jgi:hypothetical protein
VKEWFYRAVLVLSALVVFNLIVLLGSHLAGRDSIFRYDPIVGWRVAPNLHGARQPYVIYTDANGFRVGANDPPYSGPYDVLMIGDSFCFGSHLDEPETLAGLLRRHTGLHIADAGVPGYGTDQEYLLLQRLYQLVRPGGTIILLTYFNDFEDVRARWNEVREKPWFDLKGDGLELHKPDSLGNSLLWSWHTAYVVAYLTWMAWNPPTELHGTEADAAELYRRLVAQIAAITRKQQASLLVIYTSGQDADKPEGRKWAVVAKDAAATVGADYISLDDNPSAARADLYRTGDVHWNAEGTKVNFAYLAARLNQSHLPIKIAQLH